VDKIKKIVEQLNPVLEKRDSIFPLRDEENTVAMHNILDQLVTLLDERKEPDWQPDTFSLKSVEMIQDSSVFLCGYMKSGTTLLLALLDGHDELNVMPGDSFIVNKFSREAERMNDISWQAWRNNWFKRMINPTGQKPFWILGTDLMLYSKFLQFMDYWYEHLPSTHRRPILAVVFSFFCANPHRPLHPKLWVEKTPGNEFRTEDILTLFPDSKFIHIVRDPRENLASIKRLYTSRSWKWDYREMTKTLSRSCNMANLNLKQLSKSRYLVIRYEDLIANTNAVMHDIASFLDISWNDCLLKPTVNSQPAKANTMYKERQVTGRVRRSAQDKWREELNDIEKRAVLSILPEAKKVGYTWRMSIRDYLSLLFFRLRNRI